MVFVYPGVAPGSPPPGGGGGGGYASLTGPGETVTPGDLVQAGSFLVDQGSLSATGSTGSSVGFNATSTDFEVSSTLGTIVLGAAEGIQIDNSSANDIDIINNGGKILLSANNGSNLELGSVPALLQGATHGLSLTDDSSLGINIGESGSGGITLGDASFNGININEGGDGGITITDTNAGSNGISISSNVEAVMFSGGSAVNVSPTEILLGTITGRWDTTGGLTLADLSNQGISILEQTSSAITIYNNSSTANVGIAIGESVMDLEAPGGVINIQADTGIFIQSPDLIINAEDGVGDGGTLSLLTGSDGTGKIILGSGSGFTNIGVFGATPVGPQVSGGTLAGVIAGLVNLGWFSS